MIWQLRKFLVNIFLFEASYPGSYVVGLKIVRIAARVCWLKEQKEHNLQFGNHCFSCEALAEHQQRNTALQEILGCLLVMLCFPLDNTLPLPPAPL